MPVTSYSSRSMDRILFSMSLACRVGTNAQQVGAPGGSCGIWWRKACGSGQLATWSCKSLIGVPGESEASMKGGNSAQDTRHKSWEKEEGSFFAETFHTS